MNQGIVALLTDFGTRDAYAGVMKAVILSRFPGLRLVDLSHEVAPYDVLSGAYLLYAAWDYFPPGTAFCAVVDPGVGGARGTLLAEEGGRFLIAPDNGLISLLARMKETMEVFALDETAVYELFPPPPGRLSSSTFHGRDLFAPAAALCAGGLAERVRGQGLVPELLPEARSQTRGQLRGRVLHVDRFGNCITSIHRTDLPAGPDSRGLTVTAGTAVLRGLADTYGDVERGAPLALIGSAGFLELSVREGSAAARFGLSGGDEVAVFPRPGGRAPGGAIAD